MFQRKYGAQVYTVRDYLQNDEDFAKGMLRLADMGFQGIHLSGVGAGVSEKGKIEGTKAAGLEVVLTHSSGQALMENPDPLIEFHNQLGCKAFGVGCLPYEKTYDEYMRFFQELAPSIEYLKKAGMIFVYHNHHFEFARHEGKTIMDHILDMTDPEACKITFDAYWAHFAGMDITKFIEQHGDRVFVTHTKDMVVVDGDVRMTEMLTGNINYDSFFAACDKKGIKWHFIEQDTCYMDSMQSIQISRENLIKRYGDDR